MGYDDDEEDESWKPSKPVEPRRDWVPGNAATWTEAERKAHEAKREAWAKRFGREQAKRSKEMRRNRPAPERRLWYYPEIEDVPEMWVRIQSGRMKDVRDLFGPLFREGRDKGTVDATKLRDTVEVATIGLMATVDSTSDFCKLVEILDRLHGWKQTPKARQDSVVDSDAAAIERALGKKDR